MDKAKVLQEVYTKLVEQGGPSYLEGLSGPACRYRGEDGKRCAIGWLLPDGIYDPGMEGKGFQSLTKKFPEVLKSLEVSLGDYSFFTRLQNVHDRFVDGAGGHKDWESYLTRSFKVIAEDFKIPFQGGADAA